MAPEIDREQRLDEVLANYLKAAREGSAPARQQLLDSNPDLAEDLAAFFADQDRFARLAAPLRAVAPARLLPRHHFGDYEILEEIGRGGMGVVFKAWQKSLGRVVALKLLLGGPLASPADVARFQAEAEAAGSLDHPNIVPIYEVGCLDRQSYLTMKFVEGGSLAQHGRRFRNDPRTAATLVAAIARAVHHGHQRGILHRDLKPGNILLHEPAAERPEHTEKDYTERIETPQPKNDGAGNEKRATPSSAAGSSGPSDSSFRVLGAARGLPIPMVTDFGLAKRTAGMEARGGDATPMPTMPMPAALTHTGAVVGTPGYMAPEQAVGSREAVTTAADVYGLGGVLYELLTGQAPFRAANVLETLRQVREQAPVRPRSLNPGVDRDLETICLKCLEKEPGRRYGSAADLADDLDRYRRGEPILARPTGPVGRVWRWARRQPVVATLAAALLLAVGGGTPLVTALWLSEKEHARKEEVNADLARQESEKAHEAEGRAKAHLAYAEDERRRAQRAVETFCRQASDHMRQSPELQPVCKALLEEALGYYHEFLRKNADDPRLRRDLAEIYRRIGAINRDIGTRAEARKACQQALAYYRELDRSGPNDRDVQLGLAGTVNDLALLQDNIDLVLTSHQEALDRYIRLLKTPPNDHRIRLGLAVTFNYIAAAHEKKGDLATAARFRGYARDHYVSLWQERPGDAEIRASLAVTLHNFASARIRQDERKEIREQYRKDAKEAFREAHQLRKDLADAEPLSLARKADLAASLTSRGLALLDAPKEEERKEALDYLKQALDIRQHLADGNPRISRHKLELALACTNLGFLHGRMGDAVEALKCHEKARVLLDWLYDLDPDDRTFRRELAQSWYNIGVARGEKDRQAADDLGRAQTLQQALVKADPNNPEYRADLSRTLHQIGRHRLAAGQAAEACVVLRQAAAEAVRAFEEARQVEAYHLGINAPYETLAEAESRLGHTTRAGDALLDRQKYWQRNADELYRTAAGLAQVAAAAGNEVERQRWLKEALNHLDQARRCGFHDVQRLEKDPRLDPLRKEDRFRAILKEARAVR
jgi:serine/threonine protein kinase/tetratricopeptide (TPR) repeat protein